MMVIKNGIAVVAYANYGQSGNIASENQLEIHDDLIYYRTASSRCVK